MADDAFPERSCKDKLLCVKTHRRLHDDLPFINGDYLTDNVKSQILHILLLLAAISTSVSCFFALDVTFKQVANETEATAEAEAAILGNANATDESFNWEGSLLPLFWLIVSLLVTAVMSLAQWGNHRTTDKKFLILTLTLPFVYIFLSDFWLYQVTPALDDISFGDFIDLGFSNNLTDLSTDDIDVQVEFSYFWVRYLFFVVIIVLGGVVTIFTFKNDFRQTKRDMIRRSMEWFENNKPDADTLEKLQDPFRNYAGKGQRILQHLWPTSEIDGKCSRTLPPIVYPAKLWVAAIVNVAVVIVVASKLSVQIGGYSTIFERYAVALLEKSSEQCALQLEQITYFENVPGVSVGNSISLIEDICDDCDLGKLSEYIENFETAKNETLTFVLANTNEDVITSLVQNVSDLDLELYFEGWREQCKLRTALEQLTGINNPDENNAFQAASFHGLWISIVFGIYQSAITFRAWRKKFINHHYGIHAYPYRKPGTEAGKLYGTENYIKFVSTFIGNGAIMCFVIYGFSLIITFGFRLGAPSNKEVEDSYAKQYRYWDGAELLLPIILYTVIDTILLELVKRKLNSVQKLGFAALAFELWSLPRGFIAALVKLGLSIVIFIFSFLRPDCSALHFGAEDIDKSHTAYVSTIRYVYNEYYYLNQNPNADTRWEEIRRKEELPEGYNTSFKFLSESFPSQKRADEIELSSMSIRPPSGEFNDSL